MDTSSLITGLTIFMLAVFVGFEIITSKSYVEDIGRRY